MYTKYDEKTFGIDRTKIRVFFAVAWTVAAVINVVSGDFTHALTNLLLAFYGLEIIGLRNYIKAGG